MSFLFELDPKDEASARLIGDIGRQLQKTLVERKAAGKLTQQEIANRIGIDRARVNKCFSGVNNLTLRSLAELVWAMDAEIDVDIRLPEKNAVSVNYHGDQAVIVSEAKETLGQGNQLASLLRYLGGTNLPATTSSTPGNIKIAVHAS